jgi:deoxyribodipyrimidine photo-lyase
MRALVWFRRDLRVRDNPALLTASRDADQGVIGVFVIAPQQWKEHDEAPAKVHFWLENLRELSRALQTLNIPLRVVVAPRFDRAAEVLWKLASEVGANGLYLNREYEVNERRRDEQVGRRFTAGGAEVHAFHDRVVLAPDSVQTKQGGFYSVFTPYKRRWVERVKESEWAPGGQPRRQAALDIRPSPIPKTVEGFDFATARPDLWPAGQREAEKRLGTFIEERARRYHDRRDTPSVNGTSLLSPYLAAGIISARQCLQAALDANHNRLDSGSKGLATWISELVWREFYTHVLVGWPRISMHRPFRTETERVEWRAAEGEFRRWCDGMTGYPLVDAAMRQLRRTGWMHNRLRMVSAMFLTKHLLIDWRWGERWFMQHLVDGDLGSNNGGWQWSASTGTDAVPYFRIFNPYSQSERFDPEGRFIRKFVPELEELGGKALHDPSRLGARERAQLDYPEPIVDQKRGRERALAAFKGARS